MQKMSEIKITVDRSCHIDCISGDQHIYLEAGNYAMQLGKLVKCPRNMFIDINEPTDVANNPKKPHLDIGERRPKRMAFQVGNPKNNHPIKCWHSGGPLCVRFFDSLGNWIHLAHEGRKIKVELILSK